MTINEQAAAALKRLKQFINRSHAQQQRRYKEAKKAPTSGAKLSGNRLATV